MTTLKPKVQINLKKHEHIIAVVPEYCSGAGWSNRVLWVHIADGNTNTFRTEAIQPEERYRDWETDRKSTRLNSSHSAKSRMPSSA